MRPLLNSLPSRSSALQWPEHETARSVLVEPMRQRRRARQTGGQAVEMILERRPALGPAMHGIRR